MASLLRIIEYKFCKKSLKFYFISKDTIPREDKAIFQSKATFWKENHNYLRYLEPGSRNSSTTLYWLLLINKC